MHDSFCVSVWNDMGGGWRQFTLTPSAAMAKDDHIPKSQNSALIVVNSPLWNALYRNIYSFLELFNFAYQIVKDILYFIYMIFEFNLRWKDQIKLEVDFKT